MLSIPPRKSLSMLLQPNNEATMPPTPIMQNITMMAVRMGCIPILTIFLNENSRPSVNIRKMTPMSLHSSIPSTLLTDGV